MLSTIDLHGCSQSEAKVKLDHFLKGTSILVKEVTIVHGYSSSILLNYVRKKYSHPRIERKILTLNKGETVFILKFYQNNLNYIRQHHLDKICVVIAKITPYLTAALYALTLLILFINHSSKLLLTIIKPLSSFLIVTLIRKLYNRPRPCMTFNIEPLVGHKTGESFPSRHTVSAFAIAFALLNINIHLGIIALIIACIVGLSRIICAVHFISDVLCGFLIALIIYLI